LIGANFVKNLPKKLDTKVGERGGRLSIGQRQLISFARALITNPIILILDEATSSIDPQSELRIQQVMDKMIENRTTIIIAHRLSTVKKADRIIVLKDGKIIEEGNLKELIETNGVFSELYNLQYNNSPKLFTQLDNK
jgi:ABC-type multidrug transport system fused ATPase/permease subunit